VIERNVEASVAPYT